MHRTHAHTHHIPRRFFSCPALSYHRHDNHRERLHRFYDSLTLLPSFSLFFSLLQLYQYHSFHSCFMSMRLSICLSVRLSYTSTSHSSPPSDLQSISYSCNIIFTFVLTLLWCSNVNRIRVACEGQKTKSGWSLRESSDWTVVGICQLFGLEAASK